MSADLHEIIEDSISDAELPEDTLPEVSTDSSEVPEAAPEATPEAPEAEATPESTEVSSPAAQRDLAAQKPPVDDFEKKFGIPQNSVSGRENRIPYSRMKKITEKAVADGVAAKVKELESTYTPRLAEYETKVKDYEARLEGVAKYEDILMNHSDQFLNLLSQMPAYQPFFKAVQEAFDAQKAVGQPVEAAPVEEEMPQPDQQLSDGTSVYSLEGLKALNTWNREQARKETLSEVEKRFGPIEDEWKAHQKVQALIPQVKAQITEAHTWKNFTENEPEIVKALQANPNLSLEGAYRQVIDKIRAEEQKKWETEKLSIQADRGKMREEILNELKKAPRATSAPSQSSRPDTSTPTGPRSLEDVIQESIKALKQ